MSKTYILKLLAEAEDRPAYTARKVKEYTEITTPEGVANIAPDNYILKDTETGNEFGVTPTDFEHLYTEGKAKSSAKTETKE